MLPAGIDSPTFCHSLVLREFPVSTDPYHWHLDYYSPEVYRCSFKKIETVGVSHGTDVGSNGMDLNEMDTIGRS